MRPSIDFDTEIVWVKLADLKEHPKNPRIDLTDRPKRFKTLCRSIEEKGLFKPVIINKANGYCLAGNQRLKAFEAIGYEEVPVQYNSYDNEKDEMRVIIQDNNEMGLWDFDMVAANIKELAMEDEMDILGFNDDELDQISLDLDDDKKEKEDDVPEVPKVAKAQYGQIYKLGKHRLMCGDATKSEDVETLMGNMKADMVFTDPPYNVNYSGRGEKTSNKIMNDHMSEESFQKFLDDVFLNYRDACKISAPFYVCHSSSSQRTFEDAMIKSGLKVKNQIIWNKTIASMGWGDYRWKHEPIFYATVGGKDTEFYGDRKQYTVWNESWDLQKIEKHLKSIAEKQEKGGGTVWTISRDRDYDHPTQKPIELMEIALGNSSKQEDLVLDFFGGSGSTLIACEKANRQCFMMELDPRYIDVIIKRWEDYSEQKAELIS